MIVIVGWLGLNAVIVVLGLLRWWLELNRERRRVVVPPAHPRRLKL